MAKQASKQTKKQTQTVAVGIGKKQGALFRGLSLKMPKGWDASLEE